MVDKNGNDYSPEMLEKMELFALGMSSVGRTEKGENSGKIINDFEERSFSQVRKDMDRMETKKIDRTAVVEASKFKRREQIAKFLEPEIRRILEEKHSSECAHEIALQLAKQLVELLEDL